MPSKTTTPAKKTPVAKKSASARGTGTKAAAKTPVKAAAKATTARRRAEPLDDQPKPNVRAGASSARTASAAGKASEKPTGAKSARPTAKTTRRSAVGAGGAARSGKKVAVASPRTRKPKAASTGVNPDVATEARARPTLPAALREILGVVVDKKVEDPLLLDVSALTSFADFFLIGTGTSSTHVQALADAAVKILKKPSAPGVRMESDALSTWILIDGGDFVIHFFQPEARRYYRLEELWVDAPTVDIVAELRDGAARAGL
jgi:ribosome-associated protein